MSEPSEIRVWATTKVEGFHFWKDAPDEVGFLRDRHRHLFGVRVEVVVQHHDRDVEFIILKRAVDAYLKQFPIDGGESSEAIARRVRDELSTRNGWAVVRVDVDEDGENGASVFWSTQ